MNCEIGIVQQAFCDIETIFDTHSLKQIIDDWICIPHYMYSIDRYIEKLYNKKSNQVEKSLTDEHTLHRKLEIMNIKHCEINDDIKNIISNDRNFIDYLYLRKYSTNNLIGGGGLRTLI